ncbi:hypothetical protein C1879_03440 [Paraeggerthella hongkongensis]|nr:hypothetical protein C1879_03440 [Paraeggerthella hongkongensis]
MTGTIDAPFRKVRLGIEARESFRCDSFFDYNGTAFIGLQDLPRFALEQRPKSLYYTFDQA